MKSSVLLCPPTYFAVRDVKNPHMAGAVPVNHDRAYQQWEALCRTFESVGLNVELIDPVPDLEDMVFAANQVFVGNHSSLGRFIVPSRMRHPSRQREVPHFVDWFRSRNYKILDLHVEGEFLEGHGDLLWHPDHSKIWAGFGFRSSRGGVEMFASAMHDLRYPVLPLELTDAHFYHLDTCFAPLTPEAVLLYPEAFTDDALRTIRSTYPRIYEVTREDALEFVCNGVMAYDYYLTPHLPPSVARALNAEQLTPVLLDTTEFEKSGGSAFCLKTFLD